MAEMGRPRIEINWHEFEKLCAMQATLVEIAGWFGCSEDTIERRVKEEHGVTFAEHYRTKTSKGKISLRRKQLEVAMSGNTTMLIWLGKQMLGQRDRPEEIDVTGSTVVNTFIASDASVNEALVDIVKAARGQK